MTPEAKEAETSETLRRALRDLAALSALPAMWLKAGRREICESLAEVLVNVLDLEAVRIELGERPAIAVERVRSGASEGLAKNLAAVYRPSEPWAGEVRTLPDARRVLCLGLGLLDSSRIYAVSPRQDFPTEAERLLLVVASNQAAVALQRAAAEQKLTRRTRALERERRSVAELNEKLAGERDRLHDLFQRAPSFMAVLRGPEHVYELCNDTYVQLAGKTEFVGRTVRDVLPELEAQGFCALLDRVYATGEPYVARAAPVDVRSMSDGALRRLYLDFVYQPMVDASGKVSGIFVQGHDVTEQTLASRHRTLLVHELNHRVKNTLASVQSIAQQTLRDAENLTSARELLISRLISLSAAHNVLTRENWEGAELGEIVSQAIQPHAGSGGSRIRLEGSAIWLGPRAALALAMGLNELATNAAKYGALSNGAGVVDISWASRGENRFRLEWRERGGPPVTPPARMGFGSRLLRRGLQLELGAPALLSYLPEGVACVIEGACHAEAEGSPLAGATHLDGSSQGEAFTPMLGWSDGAPKLGTHDK